MAKTIGELKKVLAEQGDPWTVDPRLSDDEPLPDLPRGGQAEEDIPRADRIKPIGRDVDIREVIGKDPPSNPWLVLRWIEAELLDRSAAEGIAPMKGENEFGPS
jgi:hypothetical protein